MTTTRRPFMLAAVALAVIGLWTTSQAADRGYAASTVAARKVHNYVGTVLVTTLWRHGNPLLAGSTHASVGTVNSSLGHGAVVVIERTIGRVGPRTYGWRAVSVTYYYRDGTLSTRFSGRETINSNGTLTISDPGGETVTGGTGRYRGATGKLTIATRTQPIGATPSTIHQRGKLTY